jgi:uncharacterized C2H2 Zn-finger protein
MPRKPSAPQGQHPCPVCDRKFSTNQGRSQHCNKAHQDNYETLVMEKQAADKILRDREDAANRMMPLYNSSVANAVLPKKRLAIACHLTSPHVTSRHLTSHRVLPGENYTESLMCAFAMAADCSKTDIGFLIRMCKDARFLPTEVTFGSADDMLKAISAVVSVVCPQYMFY